MTHTISLPDSPPATPSRTPWILVGILGLSTLAMGAVLLQSHLARQDAVVAAAALPQVQLPVAPVVTGAPEPIATEYKPNPSPALVKQAPAAAKKIAVVKPAAAVSTSHASPAGAAAQATSAPEKWEVATPVTVAPPAGVPAPKPVCLNCGTVESVHVVEHEAKPSGVGAVAGAVLGGLVGNQFGGGDGKNVATVLGALGGGWAGNTVEKRMKKEVSYQVHVRMDDGSLRTFEQTSALAVGAKVTVHGDTLRMDAALPEGS